MAELIDQPTKSSLALRPKARILKTLGEELISSETVAIIELVKNAYDADADNVLIKFEGDLSPGKGSIALYDDGHGMEASTIRDSWMVIATDHKKKITRSPLKRRRLLGEKGVGRFATSRIASELELISKIEGVHKESYAFFDWSQIDKPDIYLDEVEFLMELREDESFGESWPLTKYLPRAITSRERSGTTLKMNSLKHKWEVKDLRDLQRGLSRLISPFKPLDDFNIYIEMPEGFPDYESKIEAPEIIKYPHYVVRGSVDESGKYKFDIYVEILGKSESFKGFFFGKQTGDGWRVLGAEEKIEFSDLGSDSRPLQCGPLDFELRIWDRDELENVVQKVGEGVRSVRRDLDAIAGINIYRDGFRVMPYGEPNNDWLRLDIRRVQKPTRNLSNNQITGYIAITANDNPKLHDRSNREGLDNNLAYQDLEGVMLSVLAKTETVRYMARRGGRQSDSNKDQVTRSLFSGPDFSSIKESLSGGNSSKNETLKLVSKVEADWNKQIQDFKTVISQYHALATLGGIVDKVLHDGRQPLGSIQVEAGLGVEISAEMISSLRDCGEVSPKDIESVHVSFERIVKQAKVLRDVFRRVEPFGGRKRGNPKKYYIEEVINDTFAMYQRELVSGGVSVDLPKSETLVRIDITELSEILTNLITNSIYWLSFVPKERRSIRVRVSRPATNELEMIFSDTGPGIKNEHKNFIFEPYFSDRPDGHGLGLCLVGEIVKDYYNGTVELMQSGKSGGAVFRIVFRNRV